MDTTRKLALRREALTELSSEDLRAVVGATDAAIGAFAHTLDHTCITCQTSLNGRCDG